MGENAQDKKGFGDFFFVSWVVLKVLVRAIEKFRELGPKSKRRLVVCVGDGDVPVMVVGDCFERKGKGHSGSWLLCGRSIRPRGGR